MISLTHKENKITLLVTCFKFFAYNKTLSSSNEQITHLEDIKVRRRQVVPKYRCANTDSWFKFCKN